MPGDVLESPDGSRFLILPNGMRAYVGNKHLHLSVGLSPRTDAPCRIIGRAPVPPYLAPDDEDFESDWDMLAGRSRMLIPLPEGCTCGHEALLGVVSCKVHTVKVSATARYEETVISTLKEAARLFRERRVIGEANQKSTLDRILALIDQLP